MSFLTAVQAKQVAKFLAGSCTLISQSATPPTHSQWLEHLSHASGFRDWNAMRASVPNEPQLDPSESKWPNAYWSFFGVARVLIEGQTPSHQFAWSIDRAASDAQVASELAQRIRPLLDHLQLGFTYNYTHPNRRMTDGIVRGREKTIWRDCPIIITSPNREISIQLWWLSESYRLRSGMPDWARDDPPHTVSFANEVQTPLYNYAEEEKDDSLTHIFLTELTGRETRRRRCVFVPLWTGSSPAPAPLLVEEGCPAATIADGDFGSSPEEQREAVQAYNDRLGVSSLDEAAISRRYQFAERERNEDDYTEFSGIYDD